MSDTTYKKGMVLENKKQGTRVKVLEGHMEVINNRFPQVVYTVQDLDTGKLDTVKGNKLFDVYYKLIEW